MTTVLAVDPGLTGALARLDAGTGQLLDVADMPIVAGEVNESELAAMVARACPDLVVIERQQAYPKQGVSSSFKTGVGYGIIRGVVAAAGLAVVRVSPSEWTKALRVGADKELHRRSAIERWPAMAGCFARKMDHNRADAALLALWGAGTQTLRAVG